MFDGLNEVEDSNSYEEILMSLLNEENVAMKSEIDRPINLARLDVLSFWLKAEGLPKSSEFIDTFIKKFLVYMVSHNRQSRKEIIQALSEGLKEEKTIGEKLISKPE
jgi:hypothetical protein